MSNPLIDVQKFGQSIWYDNIRRGLITSGELAQMVEKDGLLGVTSNPAIFTAAITGSPDYDQPLKALVSQGGGNAMDLYEKLAIQDIQLACDVLYPVYVRTDKIDGYISRIDSMVDDKIAGPKGLLDTTEDSARRDKLKSLVGKVAIANAKVAYASFKKIYASDRWKALAAKKAQPQRLLWASTSTKNPKYPKTYYVDELIGEQTVNTVPADTFKAFRESGTVRPTLTQNWDENLAHAKETMATLAEVGINFKDVTEALVKDAVQKFADPFDKLLGTVEKKRQSLQAGMAQQTYSVGEYTDAVKKSLEDWRQNA